jgi:hypothetical protein
MDAMKTLLVAAALLVPVAARANPRCKVSTAPADAFKDVTGAKADDGTVTAVTRPDGELLIGVWSAGKRHHATAAYVVVKNGERCSGPIIELGDAAKLEGLADLDAAAALFDAGAWKLLALDAKPSHAAAVVTVAKHGVNDVALLAVPPDQRVLVRVPMKDVTKIETAGGGTPHDLAITSGSATRTMHWKNGAFAEK